MLVYNDIKYVDFNDKRLNKRMMTLLEQFTKKPAKSIPQSCTSLAAVKAAYRFFNNDKVDESKINEGFKKSTIEKIKQHELVFAISDSTNLNFTSHRKLKGVGVLRNSEARGLNLHTTTIFTPNGLLLGTLYQNCWARKEEDFGKRKMRRNLSIEYKESFKWIESFRVIQDDEIKGTKIIYMGDRGADIIELFNEKRNSNVELIIRACYNRHLTNGSRLFDELENQTISGIATVIVPRSGKTKERKANLEIKFALIEIKCPNNKKFSSAPLFAINAKEICASNDQNLNPINWTILTTISIQNFDEAFYIIECYVKRWLIERFHFALKQGCKIEKLELKDASRIKKAVAIYTIVACRLMYMTYSLRVTPDLPCSEILSDNEWKALFCHSKKTIIPPKSPPTIYEAIFAIAKLGGFLGRKSDGNPGLEVMWHGIMALENMVEIYTIFKAKDVGNE